MNKTITCNVCGKEFSVGAMDVYVVDAENDVRVMYFQHYACGARYKVRVTDPELEKLISAREKQEELIRLCIEKKFHNEKLDRQREALNYIKERIHKHENDLEEKYRSEIQSFIGIDAGGVDNDKLL